MVLADWGGATAWSARMGRSHFLFTRCVLQRGSDLNHSFTHLCVRKPPDSSPHVIFEVARFVRRRNGAGHRRRGRLLRMVG